MLTRSRFGSTLPIMQRTGPDQAEFITIPEAQRRTGIGRRQFRRAITDGALAAYDIGGWPRVRWSEVLAWVEGTRRTVRECPSGRRDAPEKGQ